MVREKSGVTPSGAGMAPTISVELMVGECGWKMLGRSRLVKEKSFSSYSSSALDV
jgi:hypothetical protein